MKRKSVIISSILLLMILLSSYQVQSIVPFKAQGGQGVGLAQVQIPKVRVTEVTLSKTLPEEGENVDLTFTIKNEDDTEYFDFSIIVSITEVVEFGGPDEREPESNIIINSKLGSVPAQSIKEYEFTYQFTLGTYALSAFLLFNGTQMPNSEYAKTIQVTGPPIGDDLSLILALGITLGFLFIFTVFPSFIDLIRRKNGKISEPLF